MPTTTSASAVTLHLLGSLVVSSLLFEVYRRFRTTYLQQWIFSFVALTAFNAAVALVLLRPETAIASAASVVAGAAAYLQLGFLAWGCFELAKRKPLKIHQAHRIVLLLAILGLISGIVPLLVGRTPAITRFFFFGLHGLAEALVFVVCGIAIRRFRGPGFTIPALAFGVYGAVQAQQFIAAARAMFSQAAPMTLTQSGVIDLLGSAVIALGAVLIVLEDQREATEVATSQVEQLAYYDVVTGLPNRALFADRLRVALAHAQRHRYKLAVLLLDVDRFKQINDSLGHTVGDRLLRIVAQRIRGAVREEDTVARFGGDEFTIVIHIIGKIEDAGKIAQKVLDAMRAPILLDDREFVVTCSIGISIYPVDGADGETLIRNADTAMYRAKDMGRNAYQYYAATMNTKALEALEVENGLRRAIAQNEFVLYYQPLVDVANGTVFGLEALIRWSHPELGLLKPDRFIPAAEQSGLIIGIGRWVLREACTQAAEWHRRGYKVVMACNLSGRQFQDPELIRQVREALENSGLPASYLELEITEGYAMQDVQKAIYVLRQLKALGVRIAIDDFGTGYSCLSHLKHFPIDTLKLDGSFVRDVTCPEDAQIALGVIALAQSLNLQVIAEGVETIAQLAFLKEHACNRIQGYLFSRPMPPANFERFVNQKDALRIATSH